MHIQPQSKYRCSYKKRVLWQFQPVKYFENLFKELSLFIKRDAYKNTTNRTLFYTLITLKAQQILQIQNICSIHSFLRRNVKAKIIFENSKLYVTQKLQNLKMTFYMFLFKRALSLITVRLRFGLPRFFMFLIRALYTTKLTLIKNKIRSMTKESWFVSTLSTFCYPMASNFHIMAHPVKIQMFLFNKNDIYMLSKRVVISSYKNKLKLLQRLNDVFNQYNLQRIHITHIYRGEI